MQFQILSHLFIVLTILPLIPSSHAAQAVDDDLLDTTTRDSPTAVSLPRSRHPGPRSQWKTGLDCHMLPSEYQSQCPYPVASYLWKAIIRLGDLITVSNEIVQLDTVSVFLEQDKELIMLIINTLDVAQTVKTNVEAFSVSIMTAICRYASF